MTRRLGAGAEVASIDVVVDMLSHRRPKVVALNELEGVLAAGVSSELMIVSVLEDVEAERSGNVELSLEENEV